MKIHLLPQPVSRKGGLLLLRPASSSDPGGTEHRSNWEPPKWCILNLSKDTNWGTPPSHWEAELHVSLDFLCISLAKWWLESLHYSYVPSVPRPDSIWQEQALQLNTTNWWLKCMILLSVILLLPNFCQRAFLGKLCSQLGLENRQLVQGKNMLVYNHIFFNEASSKIALIFRQLLSDLRGW